MEPTTKIALITGGSRGLGKNTALHLAKRGVDILFTYHTKKEEAEAVLKEIQKLDSKAIAVPLNVADIHSFDTFVQTIAQQLKTIWNRDTFDYLINNAGIEEYALISDTTEEQFDKLLNVHFKGAYFLTQKVLPFISSNGRIVNFSTGLARFSTPGYAAYASMKGAIETFTRYLAKEVGSRGITANVVAPGPIETDFTKGAFDANPQLRGFLSTQTALGRIGQPDDIGGVVAFLCSEKARWITAQRIEISGGLFL